MSFHVTKLVRNARLPKTMRQRVAVKAVLLALADRSEHDGRDAFPSRATMAAEAEVSARSVDKYLAVLKADGFIAEQAPPTQHRPRTWQIDLSKLAELAESQPVASLDGSGSQLVASLDTSGSQQAASLDAPTVADSQNPTSGSQNVASGSQNLASGSQHVATELSYMNSPLEPSVEQPISFSPDDKQNLWFLEGDAIDVVHELGPDDVAALTARLREVADARDGSYTVEQLAIAINFARVRDARFRPPPAPSVNQEVSRDRF